MTLRRQTRTKVTASKGQLSKVDAAPSRTRGGSQAKKSGPLPKNPTESSKYVLRRKSETSLLPSRASSKPIAVKKNAAKESAKPQVKSPVATKRSPSKLSAKPTDSNAKQKISSSGVRGKLTVVSPKSQESVSSLKISSVVSLKTSPRTKSPAKETPSKQTPSKLPKSPAKQGLSRLTPSKQSALKQSPKSPRTPSRRTPLRQPAVKQSPKSPSTPSRRSPLKQSALKQSPKSPQSPPKQSPSKQTPVQKTPSLQTPKKETPTGSPSVLTRSSRKRLLPSPVTSPQSAKVRKLRVKEEPSIVSKITIDDDCVALDEIKKESQVGQGKKKKGQQRNSKSGTELPTDPELSNSFLRRKWFSLKARGGFTCLRSAILSPQEIVKEVIEHANVEQAPNDAESDFFTTKLMVRLASRLPPVRARPSCEELVDLINSKQKGPKAEPITDPKKEGTAIRVKLESRSFSDTLTHLKNKPVKSSEVTDQVKNCQSKTQQTGRKRDSKPEKPKQKGLSKPDSAKRKRESGPAKRKGDSSLSKKQERDIALRQLKDLSTSEVESPASKKSPPSTSTNLNSNPNPNSNNSNDGKRWFTLKSRGASTSLRSAILSPEELTAEFMKRTKVDPQTCLTAQSLLKQESRGSYKGVSTDELVSLIQSKQMQKQMESIKPKPSPKVEESATSDPEKSREKQLALQQLNVLQYW